MRSYLKHILIALGVTGVVVFAQTIPPVPFLSRVSNQDTTPGYLFSKLVAGSNVTLTKNNPGGNETITISSSGSGGGSFATTSINGFATTTFTFATTTTGTNFSISTSTTAVTFNWPSASASARGLLTSADWTTFNSKTSTSTPSVGSAGYVQFASSTAGYFDATSSLSYSTSTARLTIGSSTGNTAGVIIGYEGTTPGYSAIWSTGVTPTNANYGIRFLGGGSPSTQVNGVANLGLAINNTTKMMFDNTAGHGGDITAGTATTDVQALSTTQTWNNAAVKFTGIKSTITDTASLASSTFLDLLVGASSTLSIRKDGAIQWPSTTLTPATAAKLISAGNSVDIVNGTNNQNLRAYRSYIDASNYQYGYVGYTSDAFYIGQTGAGSLATLSETRLDGNGIRLYQNGVNFLLMQSGAIRPIPTNTVDLGASSLVFKDTYSTTFNAGDGSVSANAYGFTSNDNYGMNFNSGTGRLWFSINTSVPAAINSNGFLANSSTGVAWTSGTNASSDGTIDTYLQRKGAASIRLGQADAVAPVAQALTVQNVVAGTSNTAGVNFTIAGSQSTGTANGGSIIFQTATASSTSGTFQNTLVNQLFISSDGILQWKGITSSFPALNRSGTTLQVVLADNSNYAPLSASTISAFTQYNVGGIGAGFPAVQRTASDVISFLAGSLSTYATTHVGQLNVFGTTDTTTDAGIGKNTSGQLEINNGTQGSWRDLITRNFSVGTTSTSTLLTVQGTSTKDFFEFASTTGASRLHLTSGGLLGLATSTPGYSVTVATGTVAISETQLATSTSMTISWKKGAPLMRIGTSAITVTFADMSPGQKLPIMVCNPPTGTAGAITWSGVYWPSGTAPTQTTTANKCDAWSFWATMATSSLIIIGNMSANY